MGPDSRPLPADGCQDQCLITISDMQRHRLRASVIVSDLRPLRGTSGAKLHDSFVTFKVTCVCRLQHKNAHYVHPPYHQRLLDSSTDGTHAVICLQIKRTGKHKPVQSQFPSKSLVGQLTETCSNLQQRSCQHTLVSANKRKSVVGITRI